MFISVYIIYVLYTLNIIYISSINNKIKLVTQLLETI